MRPAEATYDVRLARGRVQSLAEMAIGWTLRDPRVASALIEASSVQQLGDNLAALDNLESTHAELANIDWFAVEGGVKLWAQASDG